MAKIDESELGADFNYILRLADSDVDGLTRIGMGLTSVKGVGVRTALQICKIADVDTEACSRSANPLKWTNRPHTWCAAQEGMIGGEMYGTSKICKTQV